MISVEIQLRLIWAGRVRGGGTLGAKEGAVEPTGMYSRRVPTSSEALPQTEEEPGCFMNLTRRREEREQNRFLRKSAPSRASRLRVKYPDYSVIHEI